MAYIYRLLPIYEIDNKNCYTFSIQNILLNFLDY